MSLSPDAGNTTAPDPGPAGRVEHPTTSVDVGLTAHRRVAYIDEAIESVFAQTHASWRLTICDNGLGGGDVERAVQRYLDDSRVSYRAAGRDLSLAENWTNALNQGSAPYVALFNDDDRWHPDYLRAHVEALEAHPECGFAFSECFLIDEDGVELLRAPIRRPEGVLSQLRAAEWFVWTNPVVPPAVVIRRSALDQVGAYYSDTWQYCDWELWARLIARFPVYYLARRDNDFRRHAAAYTYSEREAPEQLLDMFGHLERTFAASIEGFELSRVERARMRSRSLLRAASDVHVGAGWKGSGSTYRRALREYPPTFFDRISLTMVAKSLLGKRGSRLVSRLLSLVRPRLSRGLSA